MADLTVTIPRDAENYLAGIANTPGAAIALGIEDYTMFTTNITVEVMDQGVKLMPVFTAGTGPAVTDLCAKGQAGTHTDAVRNLIINKKISEKFDGCFNVAKIDDKGFTRALNDFKIRQMASAFNKYIIDETVSKATESEVTMADGVTPYAYLQNRKTEYLTKTGTVPTFALVSYDFMNKLVLENVALPNSNADYTYALGEVRQALGITLIAANIEENVILFRQEGVIVGVPRESTAIPNQVMPIGDITTTDIGFAGGLVSKIDIKADEMASNTWIHKAFGILVHPELVLKDKPSEG